MRDRCCGCAHRGLGSRPALVQPPRMRVGLNPARGTVDPASRRSASFAHAKWPLSMKGVPDRRSRCWSRSSGGNGLGGSCPGGPTRRRERWSQENRSGRGDRNVRGWSHGQGGWIRSPALSRSLESEVNGTRRSGDTRVCVRTPSPGYVVGPKAHRFARGESLVDSTGSQRVRVIVVESLGSRHRTNVSVGTVPAGRRKAQRREGCLARRKPVPGWKKFLTTRVGGDRAKTVRRFPALTNQVFARRSDSRAERLARVETHNEVKSRCQASWASRPSALNKSVDTEVLDSGVNPLRVPQGA